MKSNRRDLLEVLNTELEFLDGGGYDHPSIYRWRSGFLAGSPSCPNYGLAHKRTPCSQCDWMTYVPTDLRDQEAPCRFIPINQYGETIMSMMCRYGAEAVKPELRDWLRNEIAAIEADRARLHPLNPIDIT
jgi:hypothetical protein